MNLYYKIWVDAILRSIKTNGEKHGKAMVLIGFSGFQLLNLASIFLIISIFTGKIYISYRIISFFHNNLINELLEIFIFLYIPIIIINYFLLFYKNRLPKLKNKNKDHNGKLAIIYMVITLLWFAISYILYFELK